MTRLSHPILSGLITLVLTPATVLAAGFGEMASQSAIGEPFRAEFELLGSGDTDCLQVIDSGINDGVPDLTGATVRIQRRAGRTLAVVTKAAPVSDPVLRVTLEETCSARLRKTYTLLLPMTATLSPPAATPRQAATSKRPPLVTPSDLGGRFTLGRNASLNQLARTLYPSSSSSRRAFISATRDLNAGDNNVRSSRRTLDAGTTLALPSPDDVARKRDALRAAPARRKPAPPAHAPAAPVKTPETLQPSGNETLQSPPADTAPLERHTRDRLVIMGNSPEVSGFKLSTRLGDPTAVERTSDEERETLRREQALIMALDSQIIARLELSERIERLEALQNVLRAEMAAGDGSDTGMASPGAAEPAQVAPEQKESTAQERPTLPASTTPPGADRPAPPAADSDTLPADGDDSSVWWPYLGAIVVALLALLWIRSRRRVSSALDEYAPLPDNNAYTPRDSASNVGETLAPDDTVRPVNDSFDFSHVEWEAPPPAELDHTISPIVIEEEEMVEEHESAVELADIMMSFGRVQGAAETLADFIRGNPTKAVQPWIKLLEVYKTANMRGEFDALSDKLNKTFNVKAVTWDSFDQVKRANESVEQLPHIMRIINAQWMTQECQIYLQKLLRDNRGGTREGFPLGIVDDLLTLQAILEDQLGTYRLSDEEIEAMIAASEASQSAFKEEGHPKHHPTEGETGRVSTDIDFDELASEDQAPPSPEDTAFQDIFDSQSSTTLDLPDLDFQLDEPEPPGTENKPADKADNAIEFERTRIFRKDADHE